jgi:hypothetical protein
MRVGLLFLILAVLTLPALAQEELTETHVAPDGSFTFRYPAGWEVNDAEGLVTLTSPVEGDQYVVVLVYSPGWVAQSVGEAETPLDIIEGLDDFFDEIRGEPEAITLSGRDIAVAQVENETQEGAAWVLPLSGGGFGMLHAFSPPGEFEAFSETIDAILLTFDTPEAGSLTGQVETEASTNDLQTIQDYDAEWEAVIAGLEAQRVIAFGGSLVFQEEETFFEGQGEYFTPLATDQPFSDVIMAGELHLTATDPDQLETCSLLARISGDANGDAETFLDVGFATGGDLFVQDRFSRTEEAFVEQIPLQLDLDEPHHLLLILVDDTLDVYVDGELVLDSFLAADRAGTYGIALRSVERGARCEGNNVWVYQAPTFTAGLCEVVTLDTVNLRTGPGTSFERAGQLAAGTTLRVEATSADDEGLRWWRLEDGNWVREDVVHAQGDCANLPTMQ